jgi:hypothetical protein
LGVPGNPKRVEPTLDDRAEKIRWAKDYELETPG